jgi:hypothetical protein
MSKENKNFNGEKIITNDSIANDEDVIKLITEWGKIDLEILSLKKFDNENSDHLYKSINSRTRKRI